MSKKAMMIGAHPDDPEVAAGGVSFMYLDAGWEVMYVTLTNGDAGHHEDSREVLAKRRREESDRVSEIMGGIEYYIFNVHDGELMPTLEVRRELIGVIRKFAPDIIFSHPMMDYHPDHRYTSQIVMDTAYMLGVPAANPDVPAIRKRPIYAWYGSTRKPEIVDAFTVTVDIDEVWDRKVQIMDAHISQMYEWLPYDSGILGQVPEDPEKRLQWLSEHRMSRDLAVAGIYRKRLKELYGEDKGSSIRKAEAFTASPVSEPLTEQNYKEFFPFISSTDSTD